MPLWPVLQGIAWVITQPLAAVNCTLFQAQLPALVCTTCIASVKGSLPGCISHHAAAFPVPPRVPAVAILGQHQLAIADELCHLLWRYFAARSRSHRAAVLS